MPRVFLAMWLAAAAATLPGCGDSTSQSLTSPSTSKCAVTASADPATFTATGGGGTLSITTNRECQWTVSSTGEWIQLGGSASGQGEAKLQFSVAANADPAVRRAAIAVGSQQVAITQDAAACTFTVSPASDSAPPAGARRTITVKASSAMCTWTARSDTDWLTIAEGAQGTGNGQVLYDVRATEGPERSGTLTVAGQTVRVTQGIGCIFNLSAASASVAATATAGSVQVTSGAGCPWTAASQASWITITAAGNSGPGEVRFSAAANTGPERSGTLTIAGQTFTVTQASGCTFNLSAASASVAATAASGSVQVTTGAGCPWTAASQAPWITITGGTNSGPGEVRFSAAANTGPERKGTLTIAGQTFTVTQASACTFNLSPTSASLGIEGGSGSVQVTTAAACAWTATSSAAWLAVTAGTSGSGPGEVRFSVGANAGPQRSGTVTIGGGSFTVTQASGCVYSVDPADHSLGLVSEVRTVQVTTTAGCPWTANTNVDWMTINAGATGAGSGPVQFTVHTNPGPPRSGTLTVAGRTVTVSQTDGCIVTYPSTGTSIGAGGGAGSFRFLLTSGACQWIARSEVGWITITSATTGNGHGEVLFTVEPNTGPERIGLLSVNGRMFTVTQAGG